MILDGVVITIVINIVIVIIIIVINNAYIVCPPTLSLKSFVSSQRECFNHSYQVVIIIIIIDRSKSYIWH